MGRSYTSLTFHIIFSTKYRRKLISPSIAERLYEYIGGIIREKKGVLLKIGGIEDHIHLMAGLHPTIAVSEMLRFIKSNSSKWINDLPDNQLKNKFAMAAGIRCVFGKFFPATSRIQIH